MISKDGTISEFPGYTSSKEEEEKYEEEEEEEDEKEESEKRGSKEVSEMGLNSESSEMAPNHQSNSGHDENLDIAAIIAQQMQNIIPRIVTRVTNNMNHNNNNNDNNANDGNCGSNGCSYKGFLACNPLDYDGKGGAIALTQWIKKIEYVIDNSGCVENQKVKYAPSLFINKALCNAPLRKEDVMS
uniref:Reverse transcriptase domain-containing protein n=1 Tax=Tanacetum cinerariifolium TaxID=118510 RepID=A0A6L2M9T8_TANCI|nr:reverse transcriptase domain-containing protein [Tanacetum cinerariifolium]